MIYKPFRDEQTQSSVLSGVRAGSEAAWARFFDLYAGYVISLARRSGLSECDSDDVVQVVFSGLSSPGGFEGYDRGKGAFRPWLRRRAIWRIMDKLQQNRAESEVFVPSGVPQAAEPAAPDSRGDEIWIEAAREEALRRLRRDSSPAHFAVFHASAVEGLPTEDVMRIYKISRANLYQIRKRMKDAFAKHLREALAYLDAPVLPG
ncbi:MAG: sigma-70 family RNA polymerase sigma factor [Kiritimatiellae bacterium]|nr:sigma-70 family RNA polymerase sigma factor [Kiritimatiellia bacterium]